MEVLGLLLLLLPLLVLGAVTGLPRAGKGGRIHVGGINMYLQNWQSNDQSEEADATNFEGSGYAEEVDCIRSCSFSCSGLWNADQQPYGDPPQFSPGTFIVDLEAYVNVTDGSNFLFPSFFVQSTSVTVNVHQAVQISVSGKSDGEFDTPSGNI